MVVSFGSDASQNDELATGGRILSAAYAPTEDGPGLMADGMVLLVGGGDDPPDD